MKEDDLFKEIGKEMPYKVPDGFFDQISERTLQKAKQREKKHRNNSTLLKTVAVISSMAALFLLGYFIIRFDFKPETNEMAIDIQPTKQSIIKQKQNIAVSSSVAEKKEMVSEKIIEKNIELENGTEDISDVLAELSDEELLQLSLMYKNDPFF
jgi:hypothetical protein